MNVERDPYEVVPGLWIGSRYEDLTRERKKLMSKLIAGDESVKPSILEITQELYQMMLPKSLRDRK